MVFGQKTDIFIGIVFHHQRNSCDTPVCDFYFFFRKLTSILRDFNFSISGCLRHLSGLLLLPSSTFYILFQDIYVFLQYFLHPLQDIYIFLRYFLHPLQDIYIFLRLFYIPFRNIYIFLQYFTSSLGHLHLPSALLHPLQDIYIFFQLFLHPPSQDLTSSFRYFYTFL